MSKYYLVLITLMVSYCGSAQEFASYTSPQEIRMYSAALQDSIHLEITLPKALKTNSKVVYPVIYLLDKQLVNNYNYNLRTIDYLSTLQGMPKSIVVGIRFPNKDRTRWTVPNESGGQADDLITFIEKELNHEIRKHYPVSAFNLLIGHSRTAIFSSYALSKKPEFFNAAIANSLAYFDFGDPLQQRQFEDFLRKIPSINHNYYYYFSVGEQAYGDLHEASVDTLYKYFGAKELPDNFKWRYYKHQAAHDFTPGLTVSNALSQIFKDYARRIDLCFKHARKTTNRVPWEDFMEIYASISSDLGFEVQPTQMFFNSLGSEYYFDYEQNYGDSHLDFALDVLLNAIEVYPQDYDYYSWIAEIYTSQKKFQSAAHFFNRATELITSDPELSDTERANYLRELEDLKSRSR